MSKLARLVVLLQDLSLDLPWTRLSCQDWALLPPQKCLSAHPLKPLCTYLHNVQCHGCSCWYHLPKSNHNWFFWEEVDLCRTASIFSWCPISWWNITDPTPFFARRHRWEHFKKEDYAPWGHFGRWNTGGSPAPFSREWARWTACNTGDSEVDKSQAGETPPFSKPSPEGDMYSDGTYWKSPCSTIIFLYVVCTSEWYILYLHVYVFDLKDAELHQAQQTWCVQSKWECSCNV